MNEAHTSVEANSRLLRLYLNDIIEDEVFYARNGATTHEFTLSFDHSSFGTVALLLKVTLDHTGESIGFTILKLRFEDTSDQSPFLETVRSIRLGVCQFHGIAQPAPSSSDVPSPDSRGHIIHLGFGTRLDKKQVFSFLSELLYYEAKRFSTCYPEEVIWGDAFNQDFQAQNL